MATVALARRNVGFFQRPTVDQHEAVLFGDSLSRKANDTLHRSGTRTTGPAAISIRGRGPAKDDDLSPSDRRLGHWLPYDYIGMRRLAAGPGDGAVECRLHGRRGHDQPVLPG